MADYVVDDDPDRRRRLDRTYVDSTFLSMGLREEAGRRIIRRRYRLRAVSRRRIDYNFSWVTPRHHGLRSWAFGENPVPATLDQRADGQCIPYATYNLLKLQINIMVKFAPHGTIVPQVSLPYLNYAFDSMPDNEKNFEKFLIKLHYEGFLTTEDYFADETMKLNNLRWYYIHFCKAISPEGRTELEFENDVRHSVLYHGGVLAEIPVPVNGFNPDGEAGGAGGVGGAGTNTLGHALLLLGWRVQRVFFRTLKFYCLNVPGHLCMSDG